MTERQLAENVCRVHARSIVDDMGGCSLGGLTLAEEYGNKLYRAGGYDPCEVGEIVMALRHWVSSVGYDEDGNFQVVIADTIQNC